MDAPDFLLECESLGVLLTDPQIQAFTKFEEALYRHNEVKNLTRIPQGEGWIRHFLDSLLFQDLFPAGASVLDIGTGPGFPAWPLACARPDLTVTALDANGKMLEFLRSQALPNLWVMHGRAEERDEFRGSFDVVTGRAVAPLTLQLELSAPACKTGGRVLPLRTEKDREAVKTFDPTLLGLQLEETLTRPLPLTDALRLCPIYRKVATTPKRFPRPWAEMKRKPL